jgi:hypothetical protein
MSCLGREDKQVFWGQGIISGSHFKIPLTLSSPLNRGSGDQAGAILFSPDFDLPLNNQSILGLRSFLSSPV